MSTPWSPWDWPDDAEFATPVDLTRFVVRQPPWPRGDSWTVVARRRRRRGEQMEPAPAYILKQGADAIAERVYSLLTRRLGLPSAVARWGGGDLRSDIPFVAIRFEADALQPTRLDTSPGKVGQPSAHSRVRGRLDPCEPGDLGNPDDVHHAAHDAATAGASWRNAIKSEAAIHGEGDMAAGASHVIATAVTPLKTHVRIANGADVFRHSALSVFVDDYDGEEWMMRPMRLPTTHEQDGQDGYGGRVAMSDTAWIIFRIDAAAGCGLPINRATVRAAGISPRFVLQLFAPSSNVSSDLRRRAERMADRDGLHALSACVEILRALVQDTDAAVAVAEDLRTAPAQRFAIDVEALEARRGFCVRWSGRARPLRRC